MWFRWAILMGALFLSACASDAGLAPQSHIVNVNTPTDWKIDTQWWQQFHDTQLNGLMETALHNSPNIAMVEARIRQAHNETQLAKDQLNASYNIDGSAVREKFSAQGYFPPPIGGSTFNLGQITPDFYYDLDWWGKHQAVNQASLGTMAAANAEAQAARLALSVSLAQHYFSLQADDERLSRVKQMLITRRTLLGLLREQANAGLASNREIYPAGGAIADLEREASALAQREHLDRIAIAAFMGETPENGDRIAVAPLTPPLTLPDKVPADLIGMRPDITAKRANIQIALAQSSLAKIQFYPDINLSGFFGFQSIGFSNLFQSNSEMASFGPAIHLPIFNRDTLRATLGTKYAEYDMAVASYNQSIFEAMRQAAAALSNLRAIADQKNSQQQLIHTLERSQDLASLRYQSGLQNDLPALNAALAVQTAEQTRTELAQQNLNASLALIEALGGLPRPISDGKNNDNAK